MKYAYPQDPTHAISAIRRLDESSDSSTSQSNLERQQDIAVVGETVPLIFCHRFDWGGSLGINGGVWLSPRLIQLGIKESKLSMMYLLSQGKVTGLKIDKTYWGYDKLKAVDPNAKLCSAYENVPSCVDLDYRPGGSLVWYTTTTITGKNGDFRFTTPASCVKITFSINATITGKGGLQRFNSGFGQSTRMTEQDGHVDGWQPKDTGNKSAMMTLAKRGNYTSINGDVKTFNYRVRRDAAKNKWNVTSEVVYTIIVTDQLTGVVVKEITQTVLHGQNTFEITDLPAATYDVVLTQVDDFDNEWSPGKLSTPGDWGKALNTWDSLKDRKINGHRAKLYDDLNITVDLPTTVTNTIYNELEFPEVPGGDNQIVGGLSDLTLMGINGDITLLKPVDGPDYFLQSHIFIEKGIEVERLTWGGTGTSPFYGDLVYYLMQQSQVLHADQIDKNSLATANRVASRYDLYFNGVLQTTNSLAEWMTRTAPYFLMTPRQVDGKYGLQPVCPITSSYELYRGRTSPRLTITRDDIVEGSYSRTYISPKERRPVCLVMVYRDQPDSSVGQTVTVEVRYPGTALSGPFESHDLTEFCCRSEQAIYAARYILSKRRYTTHTVSFAMGRRAAQLKPGDVIKVDLAFDTTDGAGITDSTFYQIESLAEGQAGSVTIEATHFPTQRLDGVDDVSVVAYETHKGNVQIQ